MGEACKYFETPVTGGNVSFYNESMNTAVYPTPTIGMVGLIENLKNITTSYFKNENDLIYILGEDYEELGGSEYLKAIYDKVEGDAPGLNLETEKKLHDAVLSLIEKKLINSAHDVSEGGVISSLAECCIINENNLIGAEVSIKIKSRKDFSLFSESQSRVIVSIAPAAKTEFENLLKKIGQKFELLGNTGGEKLLVNKLEFALEMLADIYFNTIPRIMNE